MKRVVLCFILLMSVNFANAGPYDAPIDYRDSAKFKYRAALIFGKTAEKTGAGISATLASISALIRQDKSYEEAYKDNYELIQNYNPFTELGKELAEYREYNPIGFLFDDNSRLRSLYYTEEAAERSIYRKFYVDIVVTIEKYKEKAAYYAVDAILILILLLFVFIKSNKLLNKILQGKNY